MRYKVVLLLILSFIISLSPVFACLYSQKCALGSKVACIDFAHQKQGSGYSLQILVRPITEFKDLRIESPSCDLIRKEITSRGIITELSCDYKEDDFKYHSNFLPYLSPCLTHWYSYKTKMGIYDGEDLIDNGEIVSTLVKPPSNFRALIIKSNLIKVINYSWPFLLILTLLAIIIYLKYKNKKFRK